MCESNVYLTDDAGNCRLLMESVDVIIPDGDNVTLRDIMNKTMSVKARIAEMSLVDHRIVLREE